MTTNLLDHIKSKQEPTVAQALHELEQGFNKFLLVINRSPQAKELNMRNESVSTNLSYIRKTIVKDLPAYIKGNKSFEEILVDVDSHLDDQYGEKDQSLTADPQKIEQAVQKVIEMLRHPKFRGKRVIGYISQSHNPNSYRFQMNTAFRLAVSQNYKDLITRINFG